MILVEFENTIFNFSNACIIDIFENQFNIYFNNEHVVKLENCDTELDTSSFGEYFFKFETAERKIYFNKYNFLYMQQLEGGIVRFQFFEKFAFDIMIDFEQLISQIE